MRKTMMMGAAMACLTACGGEDASDAIEETQAELAAAEAAGAETAPPAPTGDGAGDAAAFLAQNAARDGVRVTDSGVQVETLAAGDGPSPTARDILRVGYEFRVADGTVLDSSEAAGGPVVLPSYEALGMPGLIEVVPTLSEGERARITLPPEMAFGAQVPPGGPVGPNDVIVFEIDLVEVISPDDEARLAELRTEEEARMTAAREEAEAAMMARLTPEEREAMIQAKEANKAASAEFLAAKRAEPGVITTDSGLLYEVVTDGGEGPAPAASDQVRVHYKGTLPNGETFDSSYDRGQPTEFRLDQVIAGWTEGLQLMQPGDAYRFYIPAELAYGERGTPGGPIGPDQALVFDVELLAVLGR